MLNLFKVLVYCHDSFSAHVVHLSIVADNLNCISCIRLLLCVMK